MRLWQMFKIIKLLKGISFESIGLIKDYFEFYKKVFFIMCGRVFVGLGLVDRLTFAEYLRYMAESELEEIEKLKKELKALKEQDHGPQ